MAFLGAGDRLPARPTRILVSGTSGSGKSTLARTIADALALPYTEIDALFHGAGWVERPEFMADVRAMLAGPGWVTEYQYDAARPLLVEHCDLFVQLLFPRWLVMGRVIRRTVRRSLLRERLWNGNVEPPLWTFFTDRDHIVRWAWRTHGRGPERVADVAAARPDLDVVVLRSPREARRWVERLQ